MTVAATLIAVTALAVWAAPPAPARGATVEVVLDGTIELVADADVPTDGPSKPADPTPAKAAEGTPDGKESKNQAEILAPRIWANGQLLEGSLDNPKPAAPKTPILDDDKAPADAATDEALLPSKAGRLLGLVPLPEHPTLAALPLLWAVDFVDTTLGPIQQANLLLPARLDPLGGEDSLLREIRLRQLAVDEEADFKAARQRLLLGTTLALRSDTTPDKAVWSLRAQAGGSFRQGTTESTNLRLSAELRRETERGALLFKGGSVLNQRGSEADVDFQANGETGFDRNLRGSWIFYGLESVEHDKPRRVDFRSVTSVGLGFLFIDRLTERWVVRTGPTGSYVQYSDDRTLDNETLSGWLVESEYRRAFSESLRLEWTMRAFPDFTQEGRVRVRNEAALLFPIGGKRSPWNWKIGVRHSYEQTAAQARSRTNPQDVEGYFSITYFK